MSYGTCVILSGLAVRHPRRSVCLSPVSAVVRKVLRKVEKLGALKRPRRREPANAKLQHRQFCTPLWCFLRSQPRSFIMYYKHQMILLRILSLFAQAQLPMVMLTTCSKRDFARLCRPLIPIASDPRQRLSTLKSDILILHSRKQAPLMQSLELQFFKDE